MHTVTVMLGTEGIKGAYRLALQADELAVICLSKNYKAVIGDFFDTEVQPKLMKKKVREIIPLNKENKKYRDKNQNDLHTIRLTDVSNTPETDMMITNKAVFFLFFDQEQPYALCIQDREMVKQMTILFEQMYK